MSGLRNRKIRRAAQAIAGRWAKLCPWIFILAGLVGCFHPISKDVLTTVEKELTFSKVIENPKAHIGSIVLWGGVIEKNLPGPDGAKLIVIETPLDSKGYPQAQSVEGEFLAQTPKTLDPEIYRKGTKVTVAGEITGVEEKELGPMEYPRPLVRVIEIHAWPEKLLGIFPISRGWKIDQYGPLRSPLERSPEEGDGLSKSYP